MTLRLQFPGFIRYHNGKAFHESGIRRSFFFPQLPLFPRGYVAHFPTSPPAEPGVNPTLPLQSETGKGRVGWTIFPSLLLITSIPCFKKSFVSPKGTPPPKAVGLTLFSWITLIGSDQIIFHEFFSSGKILNSWGPRRGHHRRRRWVNIPFLGEKSDLPPGFAWGPPSAARKAFKFLNRKSFHPSLLPFLCYHLALIKTKKI